MDDTGLHAPSPHLQSQLADWFPRVVGDRPMRGREVFEILVRTRDGRYSRLHRGYDRARAMEIFRAQHDAVGEMRDALTGDLLGTIGRGDYMREVRALVRLAESVPLDECQVQRVQTREGERHIRVNRRALLLKQAAALYAACNWPGE